MQLKLKIHSKNTFPKAGILIKGSSVTLWLREIQNMGLQLETVRVFPVPGLKANELYGCVLVLNQAVVAVQAIGKNNFYQLVQGKLFIPENTLVAPELSEEEWNSLFSEHYHILHPEIGLYEMEEEISWSSLLQSPTRKDLTVVMPSKKITIPHFISSLRVEVDEEALLMQIENPASEEELIGKLPFDLQKLMKGNQKEMDKFLAFMEKNPELALKYAIPLDTLGTSRGGNWGSFSFGRNSGILPRFGEKLGNLFRGRSGEASTSFRGIGIIFSLIFIRNFGEIFASDGFFGLFFYFIIFLLIAIAIGLFVSALSGNGGSLSSVAGGSALIDSNRFTTLQSRYEKLAEDFTAKKEYEKASHIYLKLLKNNYKAASVLENGKLYREAAVIHLKYLQNKEKAAECFEKGHAYTEAMALYKEIDKDEKVGDMYLILNNKPEAKRYFQKVVDDYETKSQYIKAALIYKNKMADTKAAQNLLLNGWRTKADASNCLTAYFANIDQVTTLSEEITAVYEKETSPENKEIFLQVLKNEFSKDEKLQETTRNIAYEIVAGKIDKKPEIASELIHFNKGNTSFTKDVMKFKLHKKKKNL